MEVRRREAYLEPRPTSTMELYAKMVNGFVVNNFHKKAQSLDFD